MCTPLSRSNSSSSSKKKDTKRINESKEKEKKKERKSINKIYLGKSWTYPRTPSVLAGRSKGR